MCVCCPALSPGYQKRPITVIRRRRLYAVVEAWYHLSAERIRRRMRFNRAVMYFKNSQLTKAWNSW